VTTHEVVINVIEAFSPGFHAFLGELNKLGTEATPEPVLAVASNVAYIEFGPQDLGIRNIMVFLQMILKALATITHLGTGAAFNFLCIAKPSLDMKMLGVFVSLPVILAAEGFVACREGAAIRPRVAFHVLSKLVR
jgi:hypothetical protein